nr:Flap endonuclease 1 [Seculamonas ecuadoriensis]
MGIQGLTKLIADVAPAAITEHDFDFYKGRKVAVDASMSMYQFLIAVRNSGMDLVSDTGEVTSHISGMFYRTIRLFEEGLRPMFVFDGRAPDLKREELNRRSEKQTDAVEAQEEAATVEDAIKAAKRTVRVSREQANDCRKLLTLMGVPIIDAPSEAEAQCAALTRAGKVWATGSEDMDTLTFGSPILLRHLTAAPSQKKLIMEIRLDKVLEGMALTMDQFIDLCILCGCDYTTTIKGIGPKKAYKLIQDHGSIEGALESLDKTKYEIPADFRYVEARALFKTPDVHDPETIDMKWNDIDEDGLIQFMVGENKFSEERVRSGIERLKKATRDKRVQVRMDSFFKPSEPSTSGVKRPGSGSGGPPLKKSNSPGRGGASAGRGRGRGK